MDREKGIEAYQALITAEAYKARLARGDTEGLAHEYRIDGDAPVIRVEVTKAEKMTADVTKYEFQPLDGAELPEWTAGAHLDVVVAPEFLRQYSLSGDPADPSRHTRSPSCARMAAAAAPQLMHRIFAEGRKVFISHPINHFPLEESASSSILLAGGIGVTPMIAMAHRLHRIGADFTLHYSCSSRGNAGFLDDLSRFPWKDRVHLHISAEGTRAEIDAILGNWEQGTHVYTCGPDAFMQAVIAAAEAAGFPEEARHVEYFSVPETPDYVNHDFTLKLAKSGREFLVPAEQSATDVLQAAGIPIDVKCSDGLCGVCRCTLLSGEVEHRDFVLSVKQRETALILCQSRAAAPGGVIEIDL